MEEKLHFITVLNRNPLFRTVNVLYSTIPVHKVPENNTEILEFCEELIRNEPDSLCLIIYEKLAFMESDPKLLFETLINREVLGETDIYYRYLYDSKLPNRIQMTKILPCNMQHIKKYIEAPHKQVKETKEIYEKIVKKFINDIPPERNLWIKKLIKHETNEPIYYHDEGFMIVADSKWNRNQTSDLYLLVIVDDSDLKSIRDLNANHLPLLKKIKIQVQRCLRSFNMDLKDVRMLFHYQPSYYHLHVHVISNQIKGLSGTIVGQCCLLEDVMDNILMIGDYYQQKTMRYHLSVLHPLYSLIESAT
jgi:m7GpppX diphosphatase